MKECRRDEKGNVMIEFVMGLMIWTALAGGIVLLGQTMFMQMRAHRMARYGALLQSTGRVSDAVVRQELNEYASAISGREIHWKFETGRFVATPSASFYRLVQARVTGTSARIPWPVVSTVVCQKEDAP